MKNKIIGIGILLVIVFLAGFVPQYLKAKRLETELQEARRENAIAQLRDLAGLAFVQASQKNYGLAADTSKRLFMRIREVANQTADPTSRKGLEDLLMLRDKVTADLANGDPAVLSDLQTLFLKTYEATTVSDGR